jgi:hypothetical protein
MNAQLPEFRNFFVFDHAAYCDNCPDLAPQATTAISRGVANAHKWR